jgi:hypothetical protein
MGLKINKNKTKYMQVGSKSPKKENLKVSDYDLTTLYTWDH